MDNKNVNKKNIRYFNRIEIVDNEQSIVKSYIGDDVHFRNKFSDEIIWMLKAQRLIPNSVPTILDYSLKNDDLWMKYKIIKGQTVHDVFLDKKSKFNLNYWKNFVIASKELFTKLNNIKPEIYVEEEWRDRIFKFSIKRQVEAIKKIKEDPNFKMFSKTDYVLINQNRYPSLNKILSFIENKIKNIENNSINKNDIFWKLINPNNRICFAHLDLVFGNIFFENNNIFIIDPRGSYLGNTSYGDIYYDYAKYYQSIYGLYDFLAEDKFNIDIIPKDMKIKYEIEKPKSYNVIKKLFENFFNGLDMNVIKLIEALQFITMIPAHVDNYKRQILQLCIGIQHFYEVIGEELWK